MVINRANFAALVGVSLNTVTSWLAEGMPTVERPGPGVREFSLDTVACIKWLLARAKGDANAGGGNNVGDARTRIKEAEAALKELTLQERRSALISVEDASRLTEEAYAVIKSRLRTIPGNLAQKLSIISDANTIEREIKREINSALEAISSDD
jgi:phage terminase Nu1 subunit (DNA packaging protein)